MSKNQLLSIDKRPIIASAAAIVLFLLVGFFQSWLLAFTILNMTLISAVMALGLNIQWGYAGLLNVGVMGFVALGGLAAVITASPPVAKAWQAGGLAIILATLAILSTAAVCVQIYKRMLAGRQKNITMILVLVIGFSLTHYLHGVGSAAIEAVDSARTGYLGGMGAPIVLSWIVGGIFAAGAAWFIGKTTLGLRSDYLAIATLGISEIIIVTLKSEEWLTRGVKNITDLPRAVPYEIDLQQTPWFIDLVRWFYNDTLSALSVQAQADVFAPLLISASSLFVKLCYAGLFSVVLGVILYLATLAFNSPWGRMMRCIRDNEVAAEAMGKDVVKRHLQVFIIGSAIIGIAGAMLTTLEAQFTPGSYNPLRFTFVIWIMVIAGGSGNNYGSVLGAFFVWFAWVEAEPLGVWVMEIITQSMASDSALTMHLINSAQYMRLVLMGLILLLMLRYHPKGILPEKSKPII